MMISCHSVLPDMQPDSVGFQSCNGRNQAQTDILCRLLSCSPAVASSLSHMPAGLLWNAFLPGLIPGRVLSSLGSNALELIAISMQAMENTDSTLFDAGFCLPWHGTAMELAKAVLWDAGRIQEDKTACCSGPVLVEIQYAPRCVWYSRVLMCLDYCALQFSCGNPPESLQALVSTPLIDLLPLIGPCDMDTRIRFAAGMNDADCDPERFSRSYFRRSAAAGLMLAVRRALLQAPAHHRGTDIDDWPIWWQGRGLSRDDALSVVSPSVIAMAQAVVVL